MRVELPSFMGRPIADPAKFVPILLSARPDDDMRVCLVSQRHVDFIDNILLPLESQDLRRDQPSKALRSHPQFDLLPCQNPPREPKARKRVCGDSETSEGMQ
jgi:hypothetical protein